MDINQKGNSALVISIAIAVLLVIGIGGYFVLVRKVGKLSPAPQQQTANSESPKLTLEKLQNAEYLYEGTRRKFTDGIAYLPKLVSDTASDYFVKIADEKKIAFGDIDGDGKEDAAVILLSRGGGSGAFLDLAVVTNQNGNPQHIASEPLGDRVKINSVTIRSGQIIVDIITQGPNDGLCCPTLQKTLGFTLSNNQLLQVQDRPTGWKAYRNDQYGFEFYYPSDHTVYTEVDQAKEILVPATPTSRFVAIAEKERQLFCCEPAVLSVSIVGEKITARAWFDQNYQKYTNKEETKSLKNITFAGKPTLEVVGGGNLGSTYKLLVIQDDTYLVIINQNSQNQFLDDILSTFIFRR